MRRLDLQEYVRSEPVPLLPAERDELGEILTSLTIEPASGAESAYHLTPGSTVGALDIGDLAVSIRPKLDISRVLFLASYAMGAFDVREERFDFEDATTLVEALASALAATARRAFARGLLHGYRAEEECTPCADESALTTSSGAGSASPCRSRSVTTSSPTTSLRTVW